MKKRHWLEFTEYASIAGVATGAVASFVAKQALYLSTPLSFALLVGFANRRRVERLNEEKAATSIATLKRKLSKQIKLMDQHIQTLPTPEMVGDVRNSTLRHSRDELKQLTMKLQAMQDDMGQYSILLDEQNFGGVRDEIRQLQGFYTEVYGSLKQLQQTFDDLDVENKKKAIETLVSQLRSESEQLQSRFQSLTDQTQPILSYLQEQVNHLNRQNSTILQQVDSNSLKRELDILMDAVADLAPKRDLNTVMSDIRALQENQDVQGQADEALRKQLKSVMKRLQAVPDVPQFRAQIEETLSWKLRDINKQLRTLPNTDQFELRVKEMLRHELDRVNHQLEQRSDQPPYKLIFELQTHSRDLKAKASTSSYSGSRQILEEALSSAKQRLVMVWPWSLDMHMDRSLMQKLEWFVKQGRQLDIGWCHITSAEEDRFLSVINRRWSFDPLHRQSMQRTLQYLLALKRRYPNNFKFRVLGTIENFLVADQTFAVLGIEDRFTPISSIKDISLKLWTSDAAVVQQLIQTFDHTELVPEDIESHWNRAVTRYDLGDRAGAIADINQVLSIQPDHAAACNMRGLIHFDQGDMELAVADFDRSISIDSTQTTVYCNRGFIRSEQGDQYSAIADFSLALQAETSKATRATKGNDRNDSTAAATPKLGIAYFYRGLACQKLDDFEGAITDYTEALRHVEESPVIRYHRGITYQAIANYEDAVVDLENAVTLFKKQGSKTNTRRASRHLAQAREALAVNASTQLLSQSIESEALAPIPSPQPSRLSPPVPNPFSLQPSESKQAPPSASVANPFATDLSQEVSQEAERQPQPLENPTKDPNTPPEFSSSSSGISIPKFLFPDANRSRPSMIQDLDSEILDDATVTESEYLTEPLSTDWSNDQIVANMNKGGISSNDSMATAHASEERTHSSQTNANGSSTPSEGLSNTPPMPTRQRGRRRQRPDLDKLVTSTLTNFFDEVDMEQLGTQTLDNFFAVVQDDALGDGVVSDAPAIGLGENASPEVSGQETDDVGTTSGVSSPLDSSPSMANEVAEEGNEEELEKLVTSTLTNFFEDLGQNDFNTAPPDFLEAVSHQDISEQTLIHFHDVVDEPSDGLILEAVEENSQATEMVAEKNGAEEESVDASSSVVQPSIYSDGEEDAGENDTSSVAESTSPTSSQEELGFIDPFQSVPSMDTFFGETTSESVSEGTLIHFRNVVEDDDNQASRDEQSATSKRDTEDDDTSGGGESTSSAPSQSDALGFIDPFQPVSSMDTFFGETTSESVSEETLIHFRDVVEDGDHQPPSDDLNASSRSDSTDVVLTPESNQDAVLENSVSETEVETVASHSVSDVSGVIGPEEGEGQAFGNFMTIFEESNPETANNGTANNGALKTTQVETNELPVGTETMSNLMAVIAEEKLGTQTLRDFISIMGEEKARAFPGVEIAEWDASGTTEPILESLESGAEQKSLTSNVSAEHGSDTGQEFSADYPEADESCSDEDAVVDAQKNDQPSMESGDEAVAKAQDNSISFESLEDFSDCF